MAFKNKKNQNEIEKMFGLDNDIPEETVQPEKDREKTARFRKLVVIAAGGILAIGLIVATVFIISSFTGYSRAAKKTAEAFMNLDTEAFCESLSPVGYNGMTYDEFFTAKSAGIAKTLDAVMNNNFYSQIGEIKKMKLKPIEKHTLKKKETEELIKYTASESIEPEITADDIDKVVAADIRFTFESEKNGTKYKSDFILETAYFVKLDGEWKTLFLYPGGLDLYLDSWEFIDK